MDNAELMLNVNRLATMEKLQEENKQLKEKIERIKKIVSRPTGFSEEEKAYNFMMQVIDIREILGQE